MGHQDGGGPWPRAFWRPEFSPSWFNAHLNRFGVGFRVPAGKPNRLNAGEGRDAVLAKNQERVFWSIFAPP